MLAEATGVAGVLMAEPLLRALMAQAPQPMPSPNAPNQNAPAGLNSTEIIHPDKPPKPNPNTAIQINAAIQEIYARALELKNELEHTNLNNTFPVDFITKSERIEKLAKFVKDHTKGYLAPMP
jgi:hypothetical protein